MLNDDCLGRTLDWLYAHDLTRLFAGIASRARQIFGITAEQVHVDTTSFSVSGEYAGAEEAKEAVIAITYGYSRDHRADLKQWRDKKLITNIIRNKGGVFDRVQTCPQRSDGYRRSLRVSNRR